MESFASNSTLYALPIPLSDMSNTSPHTSPLSSRHATPASTPSSSAKLSSSEAPRRPERTLTGWACFLRRQPSTVSGLTDDDSSSESLTASRLFKNVGKDFRERERDTGKHDLKTTSPTSTDLSKGSQRFHLKSLRRSESRMKRQSSLLTRSFVITSGTHGKRVADSQAEFRRLLLKKRITPVDTGHKYRLCPSPMNGDCGFHAIARAINHAKEQERVEEEVVTAATRFWRRFSRPNVDPNRLQSRDIREALLKELRKSREKLLHEMKRDVGEVITGEHFDALEREVSRPGISGHWLGTQLGVLEHVLISRAVGVNINIFQFDVSQQKVRKVENADVENPSHVVNLLFSGPALTGHFDALLPVPDEDGR